jgi:hypothetical protein
MPTTNPNVAPAQRARSEKARQRRLETAIALVRKAGYTVTAPGPIVRDPLVSAEPHDPVEYCEKCRGYRSLDPHECDNNQA